MAREEMDLTSVKSDSDDPGPVAKAPLPHRQSQPRPQPAPSPSNRPLSASARGHSVSVNAATPPKPGRASAQRFTSYDGKAASYQPRSSAGPSHSQDAISYRTPKNQTPKRLDWATDKVEESLRGFSREIGTVAASLTARLLHKSWKRDAPEPRFVSKKDWFAGVKLEPVEGGTKSSDTMRIKTKQVGQGRSGKQEKREHFRVVCIKTNQEPTPPYSFHHVEIRKNILSPNTMLTYVPHLRDLVDKEEAVYRRWLENLEAMDKTSGFATLSRHEKVVKTIQKERATMLLEHLDTWLDRLGIENCTKSTLIRNMATQSDAVTPQQKSSILNSYNDESGSPRSAKAVRMFTEAFDRVFNSHALREHAVPLRDVLLLDRSVDTIVDPKKWMKDTPSQAKPTEEQMTVEAFLETHALLGCLVCTSNSCEHGEYGVDNERKRFSVEVVGGLSPMLRQQLAQRSKVSNGERPAARPCSDECFLNGKPGTRARAWNDTEVMLLKTFYSIFYGTSVLVQCATAAATGRPCWDVQRQMDKLELSLPKVTQAPPIPVKPLPWYDRKRKMLVGDWQEHTNTHEHQRKDHFDPCHHDGPCDRNCPCIQNNIMCERFCRCTSETCANKFTGCACHSLGKTCLSKQKDRPCICLQLNRECDPALCGSCGALDRAMPGNAENDVLHATGCQNCPLQRGKSKSVVLGKSKIAGYGLFTTEDIAQDEFVIEYVGELISQDEGVRREARRGDVFDETSNSSYLFTLLENEGIWVDAAIYGNLSRYINHQGSNCNVTPRIMYVNGEYRIKFTSLRDIKAGEELFFHYGENFPNLTKKLLQEEKAEKKRRKAKEEAATAENGEKIRKKPGPKPGKKRGRKPGPKPKKKTFAKLDSEGEEDEIMDDVLDDPFPDIVIPKPRKRKRGGADDDDSDEGEYQPEVADSQDTQSGVASAVLSRGQSRFRKTMPARKSYIGSDAILNGATSNIYLDQDGEDDVDLTPKRRGKKARKLVDEASTRGPSENAGAAGAQPAATPKRRGRKPNYLKEKERLEAQAKEEKATSVPGSRRSSTRGSAQGSSYFRHTQARLELNTESAAGEDTPSRTKARRHAKEVLDSSPLSTPDSALHYRGAGAEISDSEDAYTPRPGRKKKSRSGDDEYNGNSWSDSDGVRHHGGGEDTDDDSFPAGRRRRRRPARYDD
ncbi:Uu.00g029410.m01.CDS01 [Anthostomella pinea]|uniref:Uu.00g029410.m01.CDS01 n=1 Tax=Anthostomella pinea TaxID=933095 RepID=A0AAI8YD09_9PEZI|nr:Uu.00g029410.m01.CDS01 [Anthostomella pinea]